MLLLSSADFFQNTFFEKFFQEHYDQSVRRFRSSSGLLFCRSDRYLGPNSLNAGIMSFLVCRLFLKKFFKD